MSEQAPTSTPQRPTPNSPAWLNIPCTSTSRARAFYTAIFSWSFFTPPGTSSEDIQPFKIPESSMMGALTKFESNKSKSESNSDSEKIESEDARSANVTETNEGKKEGIIVYFMVEDVEATLKKVVDNGGKIKQEKRFEGGHTELGSFWDTEGNLVGVLRWLF